MHIAKAGNEKDDEVATSGATTNYYHSHPKCPMCRHFIYCLDNVVKKKTGMSNSAKRFLVSPHL